MKAINIFFAFLTLSTMLMSCGKDLRDRIPVEMNFPLKQKQVVPVNEEIVKIAASDTWIAIQTPDKLVGVEMGTQRSLWSIDFLTLSDLDSKFLIVNDSLVTASNEQIIMINRFGDKREIQLEKINNPANFDKTNIIGLASVFPDYLFVIRGSKRVVEAYNISKNVRLWRIAEGWRAEAHYDPSTNLTYIVTSDSVRAIDNSTGKLMWRQIRNAGDVSLSSFEAGVLYLCERVIGSEGLRFSAIVVESQKVLWKTEVASVKQVFKLILVDNLLVASGSGGLIALEKSNGKQAWRTSIGETVYSEPVKFNNIIYAKGPSRKVYAISPASGDVIGFVKLENANPFVENTYEVQAGVYKFEDGILFSTRHGVVIYGAR